MCFTEGYIEVNISLPGDPAATGMWPGAWTMGNLARAGFGATNDGMWRGSSPFLAFDGGMLMRRDSVLVFRMRRRHAP